MKQEKKEAAKLMYKEGYTQKDIARILSISEPTLSKWAQADAWRENANREVLLRTNIYENLMEALEYQTQVLMHTIKARKTEGIFEFLEDKEFKSLKDLISMFKGSNVSFSNVLRFTKDFMEFAQARNLDLAQQLIPIMELYVAEKQKTLN
jgi:transposase-like protein